MNKINNKPRAAIIGFGRFGETLYRLLKEDFAITVYKRSSIDKSRLDDDTVIAEDIAEAYECPTIFYCVPIPAFEKVIKDQRKYFKNHLLIDVLSVKMYPEKIFKKYLKGTTAKAILTHPMFGPDSSKNGFVGLPIVMDRFNADSKQYNFWKKYFLNKKLRVVELSAREHDKMAAYSQGVAHFLGRLLEDIKMKPTPIDTVGAKKLNEICEQISHNTWELFFSLQTYNPYAKEMRKKLEKTVQSLNKKLDVKRLIK